MNLPRTVSVLAAPVAALGLLSACGNGSSGSGSGGHGGSGAGIGGSSSASMSTSTSTSTSTSSSGAGGSGCGTSAWTTFGHDAQRTSASDGCVKGPLTTVWRYDPVPPAGKKVKGVFNAIAQTDAIFLQWSAQNDPYLGTTAADRVGIDGKRAWTFDSGTDSNVGNWLTVALGAVVINDDGLYFLDPATGMKTQGTGVDYWGQTAPDPARLYVVNASHVDGPGIFVGAFDAQAKQLWQMNTYGTCRIDAGDIAEGIAVDGGVLFYAPSYSPGQGVNLPFSSGVYAFDGAAGTQKWFQKTAPASAVSAGGGFVYLIEAADLIARKQSDGTVAWSAPVMGAGTEAPVLAGGLVIIATQAGVAAFDATTGQSRWTATIVGAAAHAFALGFSGGCVPGSSMWAATNFGTPVLTTSLAAATGSGTLVVTAADGIHVLSLAAGTEMWKGPVDQAKGAVGNPVIVGDKVYVVDGSGLLQLQGM